MQDQSQPEAPLAVLIKDAAQPYEEDPLLGEAPDGRRYRGAFVIGTHQGRVLGTMTSTSDDDGRVSASEINAQLSSLLAQEHLPPVLDANGHGPKISVIICVTDGGLRADRAIESILEGGYADTEVVVVNNRPQNGSLPLATAADPRVVLVDQPRPGLSAARNCGASAASGEILLFTDDDIVAMPGMLSAAAGAFAEHTDASCVTGLILPLRLDTETQLKIERFAGFSKGFDREVFELAGNEDDATFPYAAGQFGSGAHIAITRAAFDALGGFDEALGTGTPARGGEDTDLFIRLMLGGHKLVYEPSSAVLHDHPDRHEQLASTVFNYGVGTTAVTAKQLIRGSNRLRLLRAIPAGLAIALSPSSDKNARKGDGFALSLTLRELLGMALGPLRYLQSDREHRARSIERLSADGKPFTPVFVCELELTQGIAAIDSPPLADGSRFTQADALIRLAGTPLGIATLDLTDGQLAAPEIDAAIKSQLGDALAAAESSPPPAQDLPTPSFSVVICTRDHPEQFRRALESILAVDYPDFEVIVIDNAPTSEATHEQVMALCDPRVHYFVEPVAGLSRARNRGLAEANGELIAFTDDDVVVDAGWLHGLVEGFNASERVGAVTGIVVSTALENEYQQYFEDQVQWSDSFQRRLFDLKDNRADNVMFPFASGVIGTGANFAVRAGTTRQIGEFDEALGAGMPTRGGEDLDYFLRILTTKGWKIAYEPRALVWHSHRADADSLHSQLFGYGSGATAYGFKAAINPKYTLEIAARVTAALIARFSGDEGFSLSTGAGDSRTIQRRGLMMGPWLYIKSRFQVERRGRVRRTR